MSCTRKCYFCKGNVRDERVRMVRERGDQVYIVEGVPAEVCEQCGERFYLGPTLEELDRLMEAKDAAVGEMRVPLLRYRDPAAA